MMKHVLLLDQSFLPLRIISWKRAITLYYQDKVDIVHNHKNKVINLVEGYISLPSVVRLKYKINKKFSFKIKLSRTNIYLRDNFQCMYCGVKPDYKELNLDHVIPRSKGGANDWYNLVTSCKQCNTNKGDKNLEEIKYQLIKQPKKPHWLPIFKYKKDIQKYPENWKPYLFL